jgi:class 3 adenylate cyclase
MEKQWRVELLGGVQLRPVGAGVGEPAAGRFRTRKTASLLAYLALHPRNAHPRDALADLLWPDSCPDAARTSLRVALASLRRLLEPPSVPPGTVLWTDRASVRLSPEAVTTDVAEFEAALKAAVRAVAGERSRLIARAMELYQGPLLAGYHDDWITSEREWLAERYFQTLEQWIDALQRAGDLEGALEAARRGIRADPLREVSHGALMRIYAALGQPEAALRQYGELERLLRQEMGTEPTPGIRALARDIERRTAALIPPASSLPVSSGACRIEGNEPAPRHSRPSEGENRLVTVLFADMSQFVETTHALHPEDAAELVDRLLQVMVDVLLKYEARVDRFLGDGALAVFGVPQTHEDDAERAVRAALEIRERTQRLGLHVTAGINTGEVYVGGVGSEQHQEVTVIGPVVNLAARLQDAAEPGQILVGEPTYRLIHRAFAATPLSLSIRGVAQPVTAYSVTEALASPEKARGIEGLRADLVGRDEELARLQAALEAVLAGQGQVVTLIGEAGVGKSRLIAELKEALGAAGRASPLWLEGRCVELNMRAGYALFADLFRQYFTWRPGEDDRMRGEQLMASLREFVARGDLPEERAEEMGPLLGNLLSLRCDADGEARLRFAGPEQIRHQTFLALRDFFLALAHRRPLVLVFEDLHWADSLSLDVISLLMESLPGAPMLLLCVYRPEPKHRCWRLATIAAQKCPACFTDLHLRELPPPYGQRLVESLLDVDELPDGVKALILEKSRGNPFYVEEIIRSLIAAGFLYREGPGWRARETSASFPLPELRSTHLEARRDTREPKHRLGGQ